MTSKSFFLNEQLYQYMLAVSICEPVILSELRDATEQLKHGYMMIAQEQAQFMRLLVELMGVRKALEIGVYTGYSALSVALALPEDGKLIACEISDEFVSMYNDFWPRANVAHKIDCKIGPAIDTLDTLLRERQENTFDFVFIDADKVNYDVYYEKSLLLLRQGGAILIDNVFRDGDIVAPPANDAGTLAIDALNKKLFLDERVSLSILPIGDGVTILRKK